MDNLGYKSLLDYERARVKEFYTEFREPATDLFTWREMASFKMHLLALQGLFDSNSEDVQKLITDPEIKVAVVAFFAFALVPDFFGQWRMLAAGYAQRTNDRLNKCLGTVVPSGAFKLQHLVVCAYTNYDAGATQALLTTLHAFLRLVDTRTPQFHSAVDRTMLFFMYPTYTLENSWLCAGLAQSWDNAKAGNYLFGSPRYVDLQTLQFVYQHFQCRGADERPEFRFAGPGHLDGIDTRFKQLIADLKGLFCSFIPSSFKDHAATSSPVQRLRPCFCQRRIRSSVLMVSARSSPFQCMRVVPLCLAYFICQP